jgi:hypothetical protein
MNRTTKIEIVASLLILFGCFSLFSRESRAHAVVNTGHIGEVTSIEYDNSRDMLFSCGEDGTIRIWNASNGQLLNSLQASHLPITRFAIHPEDPKIAVIESDGISTFHLSVWNWRNAEKLFTHKLTENPLVFFYSPLGNYIVYSRPVWESLVFLDAEKGYRLSYLDRGFGIVTAAFMSKTERTLVSYTQSGQLQYWDVNSGNRKEQFRTLADLESIQFTAEGQYMIGSNGSRLSVVELTTGEEAYSTLLSGIASLSFDDNTNEMLCYGTNETGRYIRRYRLGTRFLYELTAPEVPPNSVINDIAFYSGMLYAATRSGAILSSRMYAPEPDVFSKNELAAVTGVAVNDEYLTLATKDTLIVFISEIFKMTADISIPESFSVRAYRNPLGEEVGLNPLSGKRFGVWSTEGQRGTLSSFSPINGRFEELFASPHPFISVETFEGRFGDEKLLLLDAGGGCIITDVRSASPEFTYRAYGIHDVVHIGEETLLAGRSKTSQIQSPLLLINFRTGETASVHDQNVITFEVEYDPLSSTLYSIGVEKRRDTLRTVLKSHTGSMYERTDPLMSFVGEDHSASMAIDAENSNLFSSLGFGGVMMLSWNGVTSLERTGHIPRDLSIFGNYLYCLNKDYSVTLLNRFTGKKLMDLYIFIDGSWLAVFVDGSYYTSSTGYKNLNIYSTATGRELEKHRYRLEFPGS